MSNDSTSKYPRNSLSRFTNYLEVPIVLEPQKWRVGVSEIFYNPFIPDHFHTFEGATSSDVAKEVYADCTSERALDGTEQESCTRTGGPPKMDFMFIYCDIIQLRSIGSQRAKILKIIPARSYPETIVRFGHVEYVPIHDAYIRSISIKITNQQGRKMHFLNSTLPTMVTLHFKKTINKID